MNKTCLICQSSLESRIRWDQLFSWGQLTTAYLCSTCQQNLWQLDSSSIQCAGCGRVLSVKNSEHQLKSYNKIYRVAEENFCYDCYRWLKHYPRKYLNHECLMNYSQLFQECLYCYKYVGDYRLAQIWIEPLKRYAAMYPNAEWFVLPSSPKHLEIRGFHPTGCLLQAAGIHFECPWTYQGNQVRQASKSRKERLKLEQAFAVKPEVLEQVRTKEWLIFDDLYTTGATMMRAKESLFDYQKQESNKYDDTFIHSVSLARDQLSV